MPEPLQRPQVVVSTPLPSQVEQRTISIRFLYEFLLFLLFLVSWRKTDGQSVYIAVSRLHFQTVIGVKLHVTRQAMPSPL
jgi:hypothetical protein